MARGNETEIVVTSKDKTDFSAPKRKADQFSKDAVQAARRAGQALVSDTKQSLKKVADEFDQTGQKVKNSIKDGVEKSTQGVKEDLNSASQQGGRAFLGNIKSSLNKASNEFREFGAKAKEAVSDVGAKAKAVGGKFAAAGKVLGAALAGGLLAAAAIVGTKLIDAMGIEAANDKLTAQLSLGPEQAKKASEAAANVYKNNWGDSIGDVNEAIRSVGTTLGNVNKLSKREIESMTTSALALRDAFGAEVTQSANAAGIMIKNGMAKNAKEAFDIITIGFQSGNDRAGDWLDTLGEYAPQFQKLGIDGQYAFNLINAAMQNGARNSDIVADVIKEFSIRAIDGSKLTAEGFKAAGLDADKMAQKIAKGGPAAQKAFQETLRAVESIKDPVDRNIAKTALFGTQWEDVGPKAFEAMATAQTSVEELNGATDKLANTMGDNLQGKFASLKRAGEVWANSKLLPFIEDVSEKFDKDFRPALEGIQQFISTKVVPIVREFAEKWLGVLKENAQKIGKAFEDNRPQLEMFADMIKNDIVPIVGTLLVTSLKAAGTAFAHIINGIGFAVDAFLLLKEYTAAVVAGMMGSLRTLVGGFFGAIDHMISALHPYAVAMDKVFHTDTAGWVRAQQAGLRKMAKSADEQFAKIERDAKQMAASVSRQRYIIKLRGNITDLSRQVDAAKRKLRQIPKSQTIRYAIQLANYAWAAARLAVLRAQAAAVGLAHGGIAGAAHGGLSSGYRGSHAQEGGPRGNLTWVGEQGPELVRLPPGSMVHSNPDSRRIAAGEPGGWNKGGSWGSNHLTVQIGERTIGQIIADPMLKLIRTNGNIKAALREVTR